MIAQEKIHQGTAVDKQNLIIKNNENGLDKAFVYDFTNVEVPNDMIDELALMYEFVDFKLIKESNILVIYFKNNYQIEIEERLNFLFQKSKLSNINKELYKF